jgi:H3 lysine-79-specific histone-lysine N-methyltransferase
MELRYKVVHAPHDSQGYDPIQDIMEVMHKVIDFFIPEEEKGEFTNESSGFPQRLHRAIKKKSQADIGAVIGEWNTALTKRCEDGSIIKTLNEMVRPDPPLIERIINQTHARTVSLNLKALHEYEAGTDNVYGELLPKFVSKILEDTMLGPDAVFVDLGSGVGNVVLQAALEAGCESWGCEMMEKYCDVAEMQHQEFVARCQLWGFSIGAIHLERGDFLSNTRIHKALRRADVVLVNNQVFTPQTNDALTTLFLDLKDGCKVVSLKSFVPPGHRINVRNSQSPYSILGNIKEKEYFSKSVSWTDQGGKYFISTKDQSFLTLYNANEA